MQIRNVQLLTRWPSCQFWLSAPSTGVSLGVFARTVPVLGDVLTAIYRNVASSPNRIASIDVYLAGTSGAAVRLGLAAGNYPLTNAVSELAGGSGCVVGWMIKRGAVNHSCGYPGCLCVDLLTS